MSKLTQIKDLNVRAKTVKCYKENESIIFMTLECSLNVTQEGQITEEKLYII